MTADTDTEDAEIDLHPRFSRNLIGHDAVLDQINISGEGRTHQSFLFSGPRGVGKASAAWTLAARLLSQASAGDNLFGEAEQPAVDPAERALIEAGSHPDVLSIEPAADRVSKTISIDQIRTMTPFLSHHPARGDRRVVIVDALDAVNYNGANAMLKTLEEPPRQAIIILINHETRTVLPTIRSRCRVVRFSPLDFDATRSVVIRLFPGAAADWCDVASVLADGAPGKALLFAESDAVDLYAETCTLLSKAHATAGEIDDLARAWGPGVARISPAVRPQCLFSTAFCRRQRGGVPNMAWVTEQGRGRSWTSKNRPSRPCWAVYPLMILLCFIRIYCANWRKPKPSIWMLPFLYTGCWHVLQGTKPDHQACV